MHRARAEQADDVVAERLQAQAAAHFVGMRCAPSSMRCRSRGNPARPAGGYAGCGSGSIRRSRTAAAGRAPTDRARRRTACSSACDRAHLVGDRADAADARDHVRHLGVVAAFQKFLEQARRLEDAQAQLGRSCRPAMCSVERALALDPGEHRHDGSRPSLRSLIAFGVLALSARRETPGAAAVDRKEAAAQSPRAASPSSANRAASACGVGVLRRTVAAVAVAAEARAQSAPQPVRVTGPMQGMPRVTITHTMPAALALSADLVVLLGGTTPRAARESHRQHLPGVDRAAPQFQIHLARGWRSASTVASVSMTAGVA